MNPNNPKNMIVQIPLTKDPSGYPRLAVRLPTGEVAIVTGPDSFVGGKAYYQVLASRAAHTIADLERLDGTVVDEKTRAMLEASALVSLLFLEALKSCGIFDAEADAVAIGESPEKVARQIIGNPNN